jgi:hypothetical protein
LELRRNQSKIPTLEKTASVGHPKIQTLTHPALKIKGCATRKVKILQSLAHPAGNARRGVALSHGHLRVFARESFLADAKVPLAVDLDKFAVAFATSPWTMNFCHCIEEVTKGSPRQWKPSTVLDVHANLAALFALKSHSAGECSGGGRCRCPKGQSIGKAARIASRKLHCPTHIIKI